MRLRRRSVLLGLNGGGPRRLRRWERARSARDALRRFPTRDRLGSGLSTCPWRACCRFGVAFKVTFGTEIPSDGRTVRPGPIHRPRTVGRHRPIDGVLHRAWAPPRGSRPHPGPRPRPRRGTALSGSRIFRNRYGAAVDRADGHDRRGGSETVRFWRHRRLTIASSSLARRPPEPRPTLALLSSSHRRRTTDRAADGDSEKRYTLYEPEHDNASHQARAGAIAPTGSHQAPDSENAWLTGTPIGRIGRGGTRRCEGEGPPPFW